MKGKIDRSILGIVKPMANLVYGTISLSEGLAHISPLLKCSTKKNREAYYGHSFSGIYCAKRF